MSKPKSNANQELFAHLIDRLARSKNIIIFIVHEQSNNINTNSYEDSVTHIFNKHI